ncbi:MAG: heme peroxidase family protein [Vulcanimicrobiaceae bacterium]
MSDTVTLPTPSIAVKAAAPPLESHGAAAARIQRDAFINIVPVDSDQPSLEDLAKLANVMIEPAQDPPPITTFDNTAMPAGYTYFSQFVDHDLTGQNQNALITRPGFNKRTAVLDLDSIYGTETVDSLVGDFLSAVDPKMEKIYENDRVRFRLETTASGDDDLPRKVVGSKRGEPIVPDGRNDENLIVSQIDLAFLKYHNAVADILADDGFVGKALFSATYRTVVQHYQWIVYNDFLPRLVAGKDIAKGRAFIDTVRRSHDRKYTKADVSRGMPAEFSVAAYRMGHSMVRFNYKLDQDPERQIFNDADTEADLHGHREYPANAIIKWNNFFDFKNDAPMPDDPPFDVPQFSMLLDTGLSRGLSMLPSFSFQDPAKPSPPPIEHILAYRNLVKGRIFQLPTGQAVAAYYDLPPKNVEVLNQTALANPSDKNSDFKYGSVNPELTTKFGSKTPLWYYILKEAQDPTGPKGEHLGPLGARIVTECFIAFIAASPMSIFDTEFAPKAGRFGCTTDGEYNLTQLMRFATDQ